MGVEQILATMKGAEDVQNGLGRISSAATSAGGIVSRLSTSISGASLAANNALGILKVVEEKTGLVGKDVLMVADKAQEALLAASQAAQTFSIARSAFAGEEALKIGATGTTAAAFARSAAGVGATGSLAAAGITIAGLLFLVKAQGDEFRRRFDASPKKEDLDRLDKIVKELADAKKENERDRLTSEEAKAARMALAVRREIVTMRGDTFLPDKMAQRVADNDTGPQRGSVAERNLAVAEGGFLLSLKESFNAAAEAARAALGSKD